MLINVAPLAKLFFSSKSKYSTELDSQYLLCKERKLSWNGFSFHSDLEECPWILLKFPFIINICKVYVKNRTDMCQSKADSLIIEGGCDELITIFENTEPNWQEREIVLNKKLELTDLKFSLKSKTSFHLKEIRVFVEYSDILNLYSLFKFENYLKVFFLLSELLGSSYVPYALNNTKIEFFDDKNKDIEINYKLELSNNNIQLSLVVDCAFISKSYLISFCDYKKIDLEILGSKIIIYLSRNLLFEDLELNFKNKYEPVFCAIKTAIFCYKNSKFVNPESKSKKILIIDSDLMVRWGFSDRIRGVLSLLRTFKNCDYDTYIKFTTPFSLSKYYLYKDFSKLNDSLLKSSHIIFDSLHCNLIPYLSKVDVHEIFRNMVEDSFKVHDCVSIGTNLWFNYDSSTYFENFTRTNYLCRELLKIKRIIGFPYVTISFRFLGCLGDFDEPHAKIVSDIEKFNILHRSRDAVIKFVSEYADNKPVLILSDSVSFLNFVKDVPNVHVFVNDIHHLSSLNGQGEFDSSFDRILLDFNLIVDADQSFRAESDFLYPSGFPATASVCSGKKLQIFKF